MGIDILGRPIVFQICMESEPKYCKTVILFLIATHVIAIFSDIEAFEA